MYFTKWKTVESSTARKCFTRLRVLQRCVTLPDKTIVMSWAPWLPQWSEGLRTEGRRLKLKFRMEANRSERGSPFCSSLWKRPEKSPNALRKSTSSQSWDAGMELNVSSSSKRSGKPTELTVTSSSDEEMS
ncbi:hypothetical protein E2C01_035470 [Portunus trituberculatus]|uniref:Uncharacterized protein n=1 Tax=Portunus trituberculatus TaxID=210409 RepID=A0A5B7F9V1_PORTR|nr:hypothetical protein [Portunus trituberculatus]